MVLRYQESLEHHNLNIYLGSLKYLYICVLLILKQMKTIKEYESNFQN